MARKILDISDKLLADNTVTISPKQLLEITERYVKGYHEKGHLDSPVPTEEDIWVMLDALNWTLWMTPSHGHHAIKLLQEKYPQEVNSK